MNKNITKAATDSYFNTKIVKCNFWEINVKMVIPKHLQLFWFFMNVMWKVNNFLQNESFFIGTSSILKLDQERLLIINKNYNCICLDSEIVIEKYKRLWESGKVRM